MKYRIFLTCLAGFLFPLTAAAKGVAIDPGLWEMNTTMEMSMLPQPQVNKSTECIRESELRPEDFNMDEDSPCDIADIVVDGNMASWSINCPSQGGMMMKGQWSFTSEGDSISGGGSMSGAMGSMKMEFNMKWDGKRIGDCE